MIYKLLYVLIFLIFYNYILDNGSLYIIVITFI